MLPTIDWKEDVVVMIDQRKLPASEVYVTCRTANDVAKAIKTMVIRGAPWSSPWEASESFAY